MSGAARALSELFKVGWNGPCWAQLCSLIVNLLGRVDAPLDLGVGFVLDGGHGPTRSGWC